MVFQGLTVNSGWSYAILWVLTFYNCVECKLRSSVSYMETASDVNLASVLPYVTNIHTVLQHQTAYLEWVRSELWSLWRRIKSQKISIQTALAKEAKTLVCSDRTTRIANFQKTKLDTFSFPAKEKSPSIQKQHSRHRKQLHFTGTIHQIFRREGCIFHTFRPS